MSAFVCEPGAGSERGIGWAWVRGAARDHEVVAITDVSYRAAVERELAARPVPGLRMEYVGTGLVGTRGVRRIRYYHHWQRLALARARDVHARDHVDLVHHITYGAHRLPSHLGELGRPFVWGPVGGGEQAPLAFSHPRWMGWRESTRELARAASNALVRVDPRIRRTVGRAAVVATTTPQTAAALPRAGRGRAVTMQAAVIDRDVLVRLARHDPAPGPTTGLQVLFAGRLLGWKGLGLALAAFAPYARAHPDAALHVYGQGRHERWLRRRVTRLGLDGRVRLHGRVARERLLDAYHRHHVFLFPSLHDSGGFVTLEAQAAGLPVVCLDTGGPGLIVPPDAGVKVAPTHPREAVGALTGALTLLTHDAGRWRAASAAARAHALDPASSPPVEDRIAMLYARAGVGR